MRLRFDRFPQVDLRRIDFRPLNMTPKYWGWFIYTAVCFPSRIQFKSFMHIMIEALLTYATTLAFYLYLRASEHYSQRPDLLRSHPVFSRLLQLKQALSSLEELDFHLSESDSGIGDSEDENISLEEDELEDASALLEPYRKGSLLTSVKPDMFREFVERSIRQVSAIWPRLTLISFTDVHLMT